MCLLFTLLVGEVMMRYVTLWRRAMFVAFACVSLGGAQEVDLIGPMNEPAPIADEDMDVLAQGPVHEAFAEQVSPDPSPGIVVSKAPPDPIDEVPPEWKPDGEDIAWVPGYWFWDEDRNDYVWVSGVWRRVPPGRRWVPGYWQETEAGFQWVAGFWGPATAAELAYAEMPPESLEMGPSSPAPSDDYFWIPGHWNLSVGTYRWQPGYWHPYRANWTWVSARYVWTPRGCVFVPGYWDYTLARRGFLFAPVYFHSPLYLHAGFRYRPAYWVGADALLLHLFVMPRCHHLYFGDYYAPIYRERHYIPCYDYHRHHRGYASLYVYYEHHYRQRGIDYCQRVHGWHEYYARHAQERPPHTFRTHGDPGRVGPSPPKRGGPHNLVVHPYRPEPDKGANRIGGRPIIRVPTLDQAALHRSSTELQELAKQRRRFEESPPRARHGDPLADNARGTAPSDKFRLPLVTGAAGRKSGGAAAPPDAAQSLRLPLASDKPSVVRTPDSGENLSKNSRQQGELRRPVAPRPDPTRPSSNDGRQQGELRRPAAPQPAPTRPSPNDGRQQGELRRPAAPQPAPTRPGPNDSRQQGELRRPATPQPAPTRPGPNDGRQQGELRRPAAPQPAPTRPSSNDSRQQGELRRPAAPQPAPTRPGPNDGRQQGELRRALPKPGSTTGPLDPLRQRGLPGIQDRGQPPVSRGPADSGQRTPLRLPLKTGADSAIPVRPSPGGLVQPPVARNRQPATTGGSPAGASTPRLNRSLLDTTPPNLGFPSIHRQPSQANRDGNSGPRLNRSLLDTTPPSFGAPVTRGQSPSHRGAAPAPRSLPSSSPPSRGALKGDGPSSAPRPFGGAAGGPGVRSGAGSGGRSGAGFGSTPNRGGGGGRDAGGGRSGGGHGRGGKSP